MDKDTEATALRMRIESDVEELRRFMSLDDIEEFLDDTFANLANSERDDSDPIYDE